MVACRSNYAGAAKIDPATYAAYGLPPTGVIGGRDVLNQTPLPQVQMEPQRHCRRSAAGHPDAETSAARAFRPAGVV